MHSSVGAWNEALALYAGPTDLSGPCRVLDVGMGIAANSLALIERWLSEGSPHELTILSLENQPAGLRSALEQPGKFAWVDRNRPLLERLLLHREIRQGKLSWELWEGDVCEFSRPDFGAEVIYFDMYAPKSCPELWTPEVFARMRQAGATRHGLLTYSAARAVRQSLREAGYQVGAGPSTRLKRDTTAATYEPEPGPNSPTRQTSPSSSCGTSEPAELKVPTISCWKP